MDRTFKFGDRKQGLQGHKKTEEEKPDEKEKLHVGQDNIKDIADQIEGASDDDEKKKIIKDNPSVTVD